MTILERKNHLHQLVVETHDEIILEKVELLFEALLKDAHIDWWDSISDEEKRAIEAGKVDAESGRMVSHDEVPKKALAILNRS